MPGTLIQNGPFHTITIKELHPTFGAEIVGVDFSRISDSQLGEIKAAMAKVRCGRRTLPHTTNLTKANDVP